jgi:hypothetical protein
MNSQEPFECETESDKLAQLYMKLNATSQQDALNRIADLKTISSSTEASINEILNIDFHIARRDLRNKSIAQKLTMLSIIGKRLRTLTDVANCPEVLSFEELATRDN